MDLQGLTRVQKSIQKILKVSKSIQKNPKESKAYNTLQSSNSFEEFTLCDVHRFQHISTSGTLALTMLLLCESQIKILRLLVRVSEAHFKSQLTLRGRQAPCSVSPLCHGGGSH